MGRDDWCAVVRVVRDWGYIPMHAEVLAKHRVIWLAGFATLKVTKKEGGKWTVIKKNKEQTYDVSNLFRKGETQNGEHALERILMLINSVIHVTHQSL